MKKYCLFFIMMPFLVHGMNKKTVNKKSFKEVCRELNKALEQIDTQDLSSDTIKNNNNADNSIKQITQTMHQLNIERKQLDDKSKKKHTQFNIQEFDTQKK